ncbi:MAG: hypothetical protein V1892_02485 [bacterium]
MVKLFDEDGIEYDVCWSDKLQTAIFHKVYVDECISKEQEKRRGERILREIKNSKI